MKTQIFTWNATARRSLLALSIFSASVLSGSAVRAQDLSKLSPGEQIAIGVIAGVAQAIQQADARERQQSNWGQQGGAVPAPSMVPGASGRSNNGGYSTPGYYQRQPQVYYPPETTYVQPQPRSQQYQYYNTPTYSSNSSASGQYYTFPDGTVGRIVESQPSASSSSSTSTTSVTTVSSAPPKLSSINATKPAKIKSPKSESSAFIYQLVHKASGKTFDYTMKPGEEQVVKEPQIWKIRFKATDSASWTTYDIKGGTNYQALRADQMAWNVYEE